MAWLYKLLATGDVLIEIVRIITHSIQNKFN